MIEVDHVGIVAHDAAAAAQFLSEVLGLEPPVPDGPDGDIYCLTIGSVFLSFATSVAVPAQHIAFRVDVATLNNVVQRLRDRGLPFGNDPEHPANGQTSDPLGGVGHANLDK